jgi:hypothetical protein
MVGVVFGGWCVCVRRPGGGLEHGSQVCCSHSPWYPPQGHHGLIYIPLVPLDERACGPVWISRLPQLKSPLGNAVVMICPGVIQGAAAPQKTAELGHYNCTRISENKPHQARTVRPLKPRGSAAHTGSYSPESPDVVHTFAARSFGCAFGVQYFGADATSTASL